MQILVLLFSLFSGNNASHAQSVLSPLPVYKHYSPDNSKLPTSRIYRVYADENGYLWLTTDKGVVRFDYKNFIPIATGKTTDFPVATKVGNDLLLLLDFKGNTRGIDLRTQQLVNTDSMYGMDKLPQNGEPYLLAYEYGGRVELSKKDTVSPITIIANNRRSCFQDKNKSFMKNLLVYYGIKEGEFGLSAAKLDYLKMVSPYAVQPKGEYLIVANRIFIKVKGKAAKLFFNGNDYGYTSEILGFARSGDDLWVGYLDGKGLVRYNGYFSSGRRNKRSTTILLRERITDVLTDYNKNIWVSTYDNGIFLFRYCDRNTLYSPIPVSHAGKSVSMIRNMGSVTVLGYASSILEISNSKHHKQTYTLPDDRVIRNVVYLDGRWHVLTHKNIYRANRKGIFPDSFSPLTYCSANIKKVNVFGKDIFTQGDTFYAVADKHLWKVYGDTILHNALSIPANSNTVLPFPSQDYFLGTSRGLWLNHIRLPYLQEETINQIRNVNDQVIICTETGVYMLPVADIKKGRLLRRLTPDPCYDVQEDNDYLFLRAANGLLVYKIENSQIVSELNASDYPVPFVITDFSITNGYVAVAGSKGIFYIPKEELLSPVFRAPKVHIINSSAGFNTDENCIKYLYSNSLSVSLMLDVLNESSDNYQVYYRLLRQGRLQHDWKSTLNNNVILTAMSPGTYDIEYLVKYAFGRHGNLYRYRVVVLPLWWQTIWFKVGLLCFFLLSVVAVLWLILKQLKRRSQIIQKRQQHLYELESRKLYAQMNPHFLFNSISIAHSLVEAGEQEKSLRFLSGFAKLMRNILNNSTETLISVANEVEALQHYLQLQALRLNQHFSYEIAIHPSLNVNHTFLPPMMLQPFVENAVEHGVKPLAGNGRITISIAKQNTCCLKCIITDNGHGFNKGKGAGNRSSQRSHAIRITEERLRIFAMENKCDAGIVILPLYTDRIPEGTKVILTIPFKYDQS
jgi:hypothetical protein